MGISTTYISVIIILLVLIGFVLSIIITLASTAGKKIRHDMGRVLSSYDYLIDQKMMRYDDSPVEDKKKLVNLLKSDEDGSAKEFAKKEKVLSSYSFLRNEATHRISSLAQGYDSIKNEFRDYVENIDEKVKIASNDVKRSEFDEAVLRLSEDLSIDSVYNLCLQTSDDQLKFFKETLIPKDKVVLDKYLETHTKKFSTIEFYNWIKVNSMSVYKSVEVRTGNAKLNSDYDPSICEGCQIVVGDKLYDYSISKRDIQ